MITKIPFNDHDEWLSIRHKYIGGSDAGTVVGLNNYSSQYSLWCEKTDKIEPFSGNTITEVGSYLEEFVAQQFCKMTGKQVRKSNFTYVNDKFPWACANVDRLVVGEDAILEIKTTGNYEYMKCIRAGDPVPTWWCQLTHYMTVLEKKKAYLAVLMDCREVKILELEFNQAESDALMAAESDFWEHVTSDTPVPLDGTTATTDAIKTIYADSAPGMSCDLTGVGHHIEAYAALGKQIDELKVMQAEHENAIKSYMGQAERGSYGNVSISWKTSSRKTFDKKLYEEANGKIPDRYYKSTDTRSFRVTIKK